MHNKVIDDQKLLYFIDNQRASQAKAAKLLGVSRQAVNKRLNELRNATTRAVVVNNVNTNMVINSKIDTLAQLQKINTEANWMLDHIMKWIKGDPAAIQLLESSARKVNIGTKEEPDIVTEYKFKDPHEIAIKVMDQIKSQLKLQLEIFTTLYDIQAVEEFQNEVLSAIGEVDPQIRKKIIANLNQNRSVRSAIRFN